MIAELHDWLAAIKAAFASGLVHGTLLAVITAVLCATVLRRARPALIAVLWTIVVIKFVLPIGPSVPLSINSLVDSTVATETLLALVDPVRAASSYRLPIPTIHETPGVTPWFLVQLVLLVAYAGIVMVLLARQLRAYLLLRHRVDGLADATAEVRERVTIVARALGLRRVPVVKRAGDNTSPFVVGVWRTALVLPESLGGDEQEAVLWHELAHLRRRDGIVRALQVVVGTLFFFWPVVGWASRRLDRAREMACDQWAITGGVLDRKRYARMLVSFARKRQVQPGFALPMATSHLESRVDALLAAPVAPRLSALMVIPVAAWTLVSLGGAATAADAPEHRAECLVKVRLADKIIRDFPEADTDGDGELSREEFCSWLQPVADLDGDGKVSRWEMTRFRRPGTPGAKAKLLSSVPDPIEISGQVCDACVCEEEVKACMGPDPSTQISLDPRYSQGE